jgi:hypothetical protein
VALVGLGAILMALRLSKRFGGSVPRNTERAALISSPPGRPAMASQWPRRYPYSADTISTRQGFRTITCKAQDQESAVYLCYDTSKATCTTPEMASFMLIRGVQGVLIVVVGLPASGGSECSSSAQ